MSGYRLLLTSTIGAAAMMAASLVSTAAVPSDSHDIQSAGTIPAAFKTKTPKVSHPYADNAFTFANDQQRLLRVLPDRSRPQTFAPLDVPTRLNRGEWHAVKLGVDLPNSTISVAVDGTQRAVLPQLHGAEVVTHLLLPAGNTDQPTEVAIDELIVQDTALGLPEVVDVGPTVKTPSHDR